MKINQIYKASAKKLEALHVKADMFIGTNIIKMQYPTNRERRAGLPRISSDSSGLFTFPPRHPFGHVSYDCCTTLKNKSHSKHFPHGSKRVHDPDQRLRAALTGGEKC